MRGLSPVAASGGHSSSRCAGLSPLRPLLLRSTGSRCAGSVIVAHGPSRSAACGILPDQGSNPCPLHWQADSQPLRHQGSPIYFFIMNGCWILSNAFSASFEMIMWFLSFLLLMWCITLIDLHMLNHPCDPEWIQLDHGVWSFSYIVGLGLLMLCWGFPHLYSSKILVCNFCIVSLVLVSGWWWLHRITWGVFPPLQSSEIFWEG